MKKRKDFNFPNVFAESATQKNIYKKKVPFQSEMYLQFVVGTIQ